MTEPCEKYTNFFTGEVKDMPKKPCEKCKFIKRYNKHDEFKHCILCEKYINDTEKIVIFNSKGFGMSFCIDCVTPYIEEFNNCFKELYAEIERLKSENEKLLKIFDMREEEYLENEEEMYEVYKELESKLKEMQKDIIAWESGMPIYDVIINIKKILQEAKE